MVPKMMRVLFSCIVASSAFLASVASAGDLITGHARVVDGDTLAIGDERIRLYGIDAPEKGQDCTNAKGQRYLCGPVASRELVRKIAGRPVECDAKSVDRYRRIIAICRNFAGDDVGQWMVQSGNAVAYSKYSAIYAHDEQSARDAKRGLWSGSFVLPSDWRKGKR